MRIAIVKLKKTGQDGHIFHFEDKHIDLKKDYYVRYKGSGSGMTGVIVKGSEIELIRTNKD